MASSTALGCSHRAITGHIAGRGGIRLLRKFPSDATRTGTLVWTWLLPVDDTNPALPSTVDCQVPPVRDTPAFPKVRRPARFGRDADTSVAKEKSLPAVCHLSEAGGAESMCLDCHALRG